MDTLMQQLDRTVLELRQVKENAVRLYVNIMPSIIKIYSELIALKEKKNYQEIDVNILIQQLQNLESAYKQRDMVFLADTLEYEVVDSVNLYLNMENI